VQTGIPTPEPGSRLDLDSIKARLDATGLVLSSPMIFGVGAGLNFEYFRRSKVSPSRFFSGHNRRLEAQLNGRLRLLGGGEYRSAILSALHDNAMMMNIDRSPVAGVMGMELFAEELENWAALDDWDVCARKAAWTIINTGSLYRGLYAQFLVEASAWLDPLRRFVINLDEIAREWDALGMKLAEVTSSGRGSEFISSAQRLQHLAALEEHFWGEMIELANRSG
jgi:uncharacterized protein DUF4872